MNEKTKDAFRRLRLAAMTACPDDEEKDRDQVREILYSVIDITEEIVELLDAIQRGT